jgi:iron-sulfur cluster assembly accessory protein
MVTVSLISVSDTAAEQVRQVLAAQQRPDAAVRIFIAGRTDAGFQYGLALADGADADDVLIESNGVRLVVDLVSAPLLSGARLEYVDEAGQRGFAVTALDPAARQGGGCGGGCACGKGGCGARGA